MTSFSLKCKICDTLVANTPNVLSRHIKKEHNLSYEDYIVIFYYDGIHPVCACGCLNKLRRHKGGFPKFISGHNSKIKNPMEGLKGKLNPNYGKKRSKEAKKKYSLAAIKRIKENNLGSGYPYKCEYVLNKHTNEMEFMHSSWEKIFLEWSYLNDIKITKKHNIVIDYEYKSNFKKYFPDFLDLKNKTIYEIKGQMKDIDKVKIRFAKSWCLHNGYEFKVIGKKEINLYKKELLNEN